MKWLNRNKELVGLAVIFLFFLGLWIAANHDEHSKSDFWIRNWPSLVVGLAGGGMGFTGFVFVRLYREQKKNKSRGKFHLLSLSQKAVDRFEDMGKRLGGKPWIDAVREALRTYDWLDEIVGPNDTLWLKRGNEFFELEGMPLPQQPPDATDKSSEAPVSHMPSTIPSHWTVIEGGKKE